MFVIALPPDVFKRGKRKGQRKPHSQWVANETMMNTITGFFDCAMRFKTQVEAESYAMLFGAKYHGHFGLLEVVEVKE